MAKLKPYHKKALEGIAGILAVGAFIAVGVYHIHMDDRKTKCMEMRTINQCFSDASCTRTSEDYFRRAELEKYLGVKCELNIKAR